MRLWIPGLRAALYVAFLAALAAPTGAASAPYARASVSASASASSPAPAAVVLAQQVLVAADHGGLPFAVVDKQAATLTVFRANGQLVGMTPVLLGLTLGDRATTGVGDRTQSGQLRLRDHITTAGRFESEPGRNLAGEAVVWIDYDSALAIHRLRPDGSHRDRARRLAIADPRQRRISAGCVVVPVAFYETVVARLLGRSRGVVYVMAEDGKPPSLPSSARDF